MSKPTNRKSRESLPAADPAAVVVCLATLDGTGSVLYLNGDMHRSIAERIRNLDPTSYAILPAVHEADPF
jgi:hypothetical protein